MAYATSSTSPGRPIGMTRMRSARTAGSAVRPDVRIGGMMPARLARGWLLLPQLAAPFASLPVEPLLRRQLALVHLRVQPHGPGQHEDEIVSICGIFCRRIGRSRCRL